MRGRPPLVRDKLQPTEILPCPQWMDDYAKEEWARVAPILAKRGLLTESDRCSLEAYCQSYAVWRIASEQVRVDGMVQPGSRGQTRPHPMIKVADDALKQINRWCHEFGFSPSSRSRMDVDEPNEEADELSEFLAKA